MSLIVLIWLLAAASISGCGSASAAHGQTEGLVVVTSMSVLADLASEVVGDRGTVTSLVAVGGDPHVHEPTPSDARKLTSADLILHNGAGLEPWLDGLVPPGRASTDLSRDVAEAVIDDDQGDPDPHLWMVPELAAIYVQAIADAAAEVDPAHADTYRANAERYTAELHALDAELAAQLAAIPPERRLLVTSHDAYRYFADHYGLEVVGSVLGVSTDEEPSAARVRWLIDEIRRLEVPTIFVESTVDPRVIEQVARETGVAIGRPLYGDSLGERSSGADTYAGMLRSNVSALVEGLAP